VLNMLRQWWLPLWLFTLYFIYPIPNTIALRNALLISGLAGCLWVIRRNRGSIPWQTLGAFRTSGWILAILTGWLLFQSAFISPYPDLALDMLRGDWFNELLIAITGACAVLAARNGGIQRLITSLVLALFAHVALLLVYQLWLWIFTSAHVLSETPFAQKDYHSTLVTALIALLLADLISRVIIKRAALTTNWQATLLMLALSFVATATLMARNGFVIVVALMVLTISIFFIAGRQRLGRHSASAMIIFILFCSVATWIGMRSDTRWEGLSDAATAAFDTQHNLAWLNSRQHPVPLMKNGKRVEESAYMRLAWATVALEQIQRYPLGLGYGHKAFGWAVNRSYNLQTGHESSHSGLLDFALANGIPGLVLWLALSAALTVNGWRAFRKDASAVGLLLVFTVQGYLVRCLIDGHLSSFRLEMFALLVGMLIAAQAVEKESCN
jgi:hypothetical protein